MLQYSLIKDEKWNMKIYVLNLNTVHHLPDEVALIVTNVLVVVGASFLEIYALVEMSIGCV